MQAGRQEGEHMAEYQGGAAASSYASMGKTGKAADAATNTEDTLTLGPTPTPSSSSSSLASLLLTKEGGRAGPAAAMLTSPVVGVGGKARTMASREELSVPSSEEGDWLLAQHKRQAQPPHPALEQNLGGGEKALEDDMGGPACKAAAPAAMAAVPIAGTMNPQPRHRRNSAEWLRAVHVAAFVGAEITSEEMAVLRSLAFGMGAADMVVEEC